MNYSKDLFEPIRENSKVALILFLIKKGDDCLSECGFLENLSLTSFSWV